MRLILGGCADAPRRRTVVAAQRADYLCTDPCGRIWVYVQLPHAKNLFDGIMLASEAARRGYLRAPIALGKRVA